MAPNNSTEYLFEILTTLLTDVSKTYGAVFNTRSLKLTLAKAKARTESEGISFFTKTLPRFGKALDKALSDETPLDCTSLRFSRYERSSKLPRFLGEFTSRVLSQDGKLLQVPDATCVSVLRQILYPFYKYELPYTDEQELSTIAKFRKTESDLIDTGIQLRETAAILERETQASFAWHMGEAGRPTYVSSKILEVTRAARQLLAELLADFDPYDIVPRHGPGAVATKQQLWSKYEFTNVCKRITDRFPLDAYFMASPEFICDRGARFQALTQNESSAKVCLVPKDSRGPRLISCEPVDFQWIQQGIMYGLVSYVENHWLTKHSVFFTDQVPNRIAARFGSETKRYATLDLNEASDRISLDLVRLLFPANLVEAAEACRSLSTVLPDGSTLTLNKFAPMGSALCFPFLALSVWAILTAGIDKADADARESIHVYGDDVIVPTAKAGDAIERLELFGLKVNRDKSCTKGQFRESCGMDAFQGVDVTPVRFRTVWSSEPSPDVYSSWIAYANQLYDRRYYLTYDLIVSRLLDIYGPIPSDELHCGAPSLRYIPICNVGPRRRWNKNLQRFEHRVRVIQASKVKHISDGYDMLLRFFTEAGRAETSTDTFRRKEREYLGIGLADAPPFSVSAYTKRNTGKLVWRWR